MTKQDYVLIAAILNVTPNVEPTSRRVLAESFAAAFGQLNARFDADRFLEAALKLDQPR